VVGDLLHSITTTPDVFINRSRSIFNLVYLYTVIA